ncbi:MAG TPA: AMP-binding protein [Vicinamibacterales bacterium]|nr:AMP-binding protein [Vicinamibacterales bacterium]
MVNASGRPWLRFYHEQTAKDLPPLAWPHLPAFIREAARQYADKPAFTLYLPNGTQGTLTYRDVDRRSDEFAVYLREVAGFQPGDRIALQMPNCLAYPIAVFGCLKAGLVMANTNPLYTPAEMTHQFQDSGAVGLIAIDVFGKKVAEVLPQTTIRHVVLVSIPDLLPPLKRFVVRTVQKYVKKMIPPISFAHVSFPDALEQGAASIAAGASAEPYAASLTHESIAALQYTGGTTGVSKGAVLTHRNLLANIVASLEAWKPSLTYGREVMLTALPLYHIFAFTANLMIFFAVGGRNILIPSPRPFTNLKLAMEREPITWFTGINTLFVALMNEPWFQAKKDWMLKGTVAGGMALVPAVGERWQQMTNTPVYQGYGLTETSPVVTLVPFHRNKMSSIGVPVPGTDVRLVDDSGADVPAGQPGELIVRGPQVMQSYWQRPDETAEVIRDGWLYTGDIATMDEDGYFQIVDRKKDMILVSGFNVYPNEVEAVLAEHAGVAEVCVLGTPDPLCGEAVVAFVVRKDPALTPEQLRLHAKAQLTNYKVPRTFVFRDELPKSNVGKILRKDLKGAAADAHQPSQA